MKLYNDDLDCILVGFVLFTFVVHYRAANIYRIVECLNICIRFEFSLVRTSRCARHPSGTSERVLIEHRPKRAPVAARGAADRYLYGTVISVFAKDNA